MKKNKKGRFQRPIFKNKIMEETTQPQPMGEETMGMSEDKGDEIDAITILSYIGILFLVPLLTRKEDGFSQFHAKQGMVLFLAEVATVFVAWIPLLGWLVGGLLWVAWIVLSVLGIVNVVKGKKEELPVIGEFAHKLKV